MTINQSIKRCISQNSLFYFYLPAYLFSHSSLVSLMPFVIESKKHLKVYSVPKNYLLNY